MFRRMFAVAAIAVVALAACSDDPEPAQGTQGSAVADELTDPMVAEDGSSGLGSCAVEFDQQALAERDFAFDGTVAEIADPAAEDAPYEVTFEVSTWYRGGDGSSVTLMTYDVSGTSLAGDLALERGQRVLASGDDEFLWGCGFSMPYSEADAVTFEEAFTQ